MSIEYQIRPTDLAKAYFYNLQCSPRTRLIIFGLATILMILNLALGFIARGGPLGTVDYLFAISVGVFVVIAIPLVSMVTAKRDKRILTISPIGIDARIGPQEGRVFWKAIESVKDIGGIVLLTGKNANTLTIPEYAFSNDSHRDTFVKLAGEYHVAATKDANGQ